MNKIRLGLNIDHIATLRNARKINKPSISEVLKIITNTKIDIITIHLREDRRHIDEYDVEFLIKNSNININLEMANTPEMVDYVLKFKPYECCLVPEKREELTTEGGLDIIKHQDSLSTSIKKIKEETNTIVSLFVEPEIKQIEICKKIGADAIEIHTGKYANLFMDNENYNDELQRINQAVQFAKELGLRVHAGHGLNYDNIHNIVNIKNIEELNIGFEIITEAIFIGLENAINKMYNLINK